uniref:Ribosomal RNA-processing protein 8 n=1 Tax=Apteryx owenii TaxID=8824 RepID=A0A8B9QCF3_APTOW
HFQQPGSGTETAEAQGKGAPGLGLTSLCRVVSGVSQVPLAAESVDVAVFCLALMGTNLQEILEEANRVLKQGGTLMMAEVASRFEDLRAFVNSMAHLGFKSVSKVASTHSMIFFMSKASPPASWS